MDQQRRAKVISWSQVEPVTVDQARAHIEAQRLDDSTIDDVDDEMLEAWIAAARQSCENFTGLSFVTKTLEIALDAWPTVRQNGSVAVELPGGPVREVLSITIGDASSSSSSSSSSSDSSIVDPTSYILNDYFEPPRVVPVTSWPVVTKATNAIKIRYLAGYGEDSDGGEVLPAALRSALLLVCATLYANREDFAKTGIAPVPINSEYLLRPYRVSKGFA